VQAVKVQDMDDNAPTVVLIHGLWMKGVEMTLLRRRLRRAGFRVQLFRYASLMRALPDNAQRLHAFIQGLDAETVHLVAHSLGGLLVRQLFHDHPSQPAGRVVTLGSPHAGSRVADAMAATGVTGFLLGRSAEPLRGEVPGWECPRALGSLAGDLSMGIGWLVPALPRPNDGTVAVAETRLAGMAEHRVVHASHFGLLFSAEAARQTVCFLQQGHFCND
jgi:pimeloyl-ACP methyl ester carboxylesterase